MRKQIALLLALGLLVLSACDGTPAPQSSSEEAATTTQTTTTTEEEVIEEEAFSMETGLTDRMKERCILREGDGTRVAAVMKKAQAGEDVTIAFIGGSITAGSLATDNKGWATMIRTWWREAFPDCKFTFVNASIGATDSYLGVHRVDRDVLAENPDLVFVEFSVNDEAPINQDSYESLVLKILRAEQNPAVVCLCMAQSSGATYQAQHEEIGEFYDLPMISFWDCVKPTIDAGYVTWEDILVDGLHPGDAGHDLVKQMVAAYLDTVKEQLDSYAAEIKPIDAVLNDRFAFARILGSDSEELANAEVSGFEAGAIFNQFKNGWKATAAGSSIKFSLEAKSLGISYLMQTSGAPGKAEVYVNGTLVATLDADFAGGWGNYAKSEEVFASDGLLEPMEVEIKVAKGENAEFTLLAVLAS